MLAPRRIVPKPLLALSTVSHTWSQVAHSFMYRSIIIRENDRRVCRLQLLVRTLESKPRLASLVRKLTFEVRAGGGIKAGQDLFYYGQIARIGSLCQNLTRLDLGPCWPMGDADLLRIVENYRSLREFSIAGCEKITPKGLRKVLPFLTNLRKLDAANVDKINDDCLRAIVQTCPLLEYLDVWKTKITPTGVLSIVDLAPKFATLNVSPFSRLNASELETMRIQRPPDFKITARNQHEIYRDSDSDGSYFSDYDLDDLCNWTSDDDSENYEWSDVYGG
ncbi:hypothetical protein DFS34DRAFT_267709 [Phlyctochytrium arcticum]|nr:hypothetical protein DFS34DRAFT_267709 [Phlyctochytrium arcticum]